MISLNWILHESIDIVFQNQQVKNTLWEGGVRGSGFLWSANLQKRHRVATQLMNIQDWLPTLFSVAGIFKKRTYFLICVHSNVHTMHSLSFSNVFRKKV